MTDELAIFDDLTFIDSYYDMFVLWWQHQLRQKLDVWYALALGEFGVILFLFHGGFTLLMHGLFRVCGA